jgi:surfactin synthase thioesterase subunit
MLVIGPSRNLSDEYFIPGQPEGPVPDRRYWSKMSDYSASDDLWLRRYHPVRSPVARLVCLPHAGGSAPFFRPVSAALFPNPGGPSPDVDVVAVQYPGRQERRAEQPMDDIAALADRISGILLRQPELPVTLFGHSMGAILAFEVARRLEADGHGPVRLFASGRRGPSAYRNETVHLRDDASILDELRRLNGTASSVLGDDELMRAALPSLRADYKAAETYMSAPEAIVSCPISVLTGDDDPKTTIKEAKDWAKHTTGSFDTHVFAGGHFFLTDHSAEIIKLLQQHFEAENARDSAITCPDDCAGRTLA